MKNKWTLRQTVFTSTLDHLEEFTSKWQHATILVLGDFRPQPHHLPCMVNVSPLKGPHLANAPSRKIEKRHRVSEIVGQVLSQSEKTAVVQKTLPCVVLLQQRN